jgi:hypothetical protein
MWLISLFWESKKIESRQSWLLSIGFFESKIMNPLNQLAMMIMLRPTISLRKHKKCDDRIAKDLMERWFLFWDNDGGQRC